MASQSPFRSCTRFLNGHGPRKPAQALKLALAEVADDEVADIYGTGAIIEDFERDLAKTLGTEAALFMPSGTMAQQIALRICCDRADNPRVAMHATSHLQLHEQDAIRILHGLQPCLLADTARLFDIDDLKALETLPAAVLWELPQREIGGQLPSWETLCEQVQWARDQSIHCHLDGARLWEAAPFYQRSHAEISSLFDSVYVSFYKGLGGIAGAALAGKTTFLDEARPWLRRHGGNLISLYPFVLSARAGMKKYLGQFAGYQQRARAIAAVLDGIEGITVVPRVPPTQMMHLHIARPAAQLNANNAALARTEHAMLFGNARPIDDGHALVELSIGSASTAFTLDEIAALFEQILST